MTMQRETINRLLLPLPLGVRRYADLWKPGLRSFADVVSCQRMGVRVTKKSKTEFAKKLKNWRDREGMSQSQAAALLGVSVRSLQNWEIARTKPSTLAERLMDRLFIGDECVIGDSVRIKEMAKVGDYCTIRHGATIGEGAKIGNGVYIGFMATINP